MELLMIDGNKMKITLSEEELSAYSLTCDQIDYDNTETRRAFWSIFDEVKHRTGFDAAAEKIYVQVYPARGGGCEMFVTKLPGKGTPAVSLKKAKERPHKAAVDRPVLFSFATLRDLLAACAALATLGFEGASSAYEAEGVCYLLLDRAKLRTTGESEGETVAAAGLSSGQTKSSDASLTVPACDRIDACTPIRADGRNDTRSEIRADARADARAVARNDRENREESLCALLSEFGEEVGGSALSLLGERASCLCPENAVSRCAALAACPPGRKKIPSPENVG